MSDDLAQKHAIDVQLLAISCARSYGMLTIGALIGLNAIGYILTPHMNAFVLGAALGVISATAAYANFALIASGSIPVYENGVLGGYRTSRLIVPAMVFSIVCGAGSGLMFLQGAL